MYDVEPEKELTKGEKTKGGIKKIFDGAFNIVQTFVIVAAVFVVLYLILITPHQVDGISMDPTFKNDEFLIANKMVYNFRTPHRGEIVIFRFSETRDFIKRIVGLPGDVVELRDGSYYINGELLLESYLDPSVYTQGNAFLKEGDALIVPDGQVFVSGDNRPYSSDSRAFGPIEINQIKGKVFLVVFPLTEIKFIKDPSY